MQTEDSKNKPDLVIPIILNTILFNIFIFLRIFYGNFTFLVSTLTLIAHALLPWIILLFLLKNKIYRLNQSPNLKPSGAKFLSAFTAFNILLCITGILGVINQKLDSSKELEMTLKIEEVERKTSKYNSYYVAIVTPPFKTGGFGIPDAKIDLGISKEDEKNFKIGTSKIYVRYKEGLFNLPWILEKKFIP